MRRYAGCCLDDSPPSVASSPPPPSPLPPPPPPPSPSPPPPVFCDCSCYATHAGPTEDDDDDDASAGASLITYAPDRLPTCQPIWNGRWCRCEGVSPPDDGGDDDDGGEGGSGEGGSGEGGSGSGEGSRGRRLFYSGGSRVRYHRCCAPSVTPLAPPPPLRPPCPPDPPPPPSPLPRPPTSECGCECYEVYASSGQENVDGQEDVDTRRLQCYAQAGRCSCVRNLGWWQVGCHALICAQDPHLLVPRNPQPSTCLPKLASPAGSSHLLKCFPTLSRHGFAFVCCALDDRYSTFAVRSHPSGSTLSAAMGHYPAGRRPVRCCDDASPKHEHAHALLCMHTCRCNCACRRDALAAVHNRVSCRAIFGRCRCYYEEVRDDCPFCFGIPKVHMLG